MSSTLDQSILVDALVSIGYEYISTPEQDRAVRIQCCWCRQSKEEYIDTNDVSTIKSRVIHSTKCPVALAQKMSERFLSLT